MVVNTPTRRWHYARVRTQSDKCVSFCLKCRAGRWWQEKAARMLPNDHQLEVFLYNKRGGCNAWVEHFFPFKSASERQRAAQHGSFLTVSYPYNAVAPSAPSCHLGVCVVQTVLPRAARSSSIFPSNRCCARTACSIRGRERHFSASCENRWPLGPSLENLLPVIMPTALTAPFLPWPWYATLAN